MHCHHVLSREFLPHEVLGYSSGAGIFFALCYLLWISERAYLNIALQYNLRDPIFAILFQKFHEASIYRPIQNLSQGRVGPIHNLYHVHSSYYGPASLLHIHTQLNHLCLLFTEFNTAGSRVDNNAFYSSTRRCR